MKSQSLSESSHFARLAVAFALVVSGAFVTGCGGHGRQVIAPSSEIRTEGAARVVLKRVDRNIFDMTVHNLSGKNMVVDRDGIRLATPQGTLSREPGGAARTYTIPAGGAHDVKVKFALADLPPATQAQVTFDGAMTADGAPLKVDPLPVIVQ